MGVSPTDGDPTTVPPPPIDKPTFEECYSEIESIVDSRRADWTYVSILDWPDVRQLLLIHLWNKFNLFDPKKGPLENWTNTVISHRLINLRRDHLLRLSRPCIGGGKWGNGKMCEYNRGGDSCAYTASRTQCDECPLYKEWQETREHQLNLKSTVALENHAQEVSNIQGDFTDVAEVKDWLDLQMIKELTRWEGRVYRLLYIKNLSPTATSQELALVIKSRKRPPASHEGFNYQSVLAYQRRFKEMMMEVLRRGGHI